MQCMVEEDLPVGSGDSGETLVRVQPRFVRLLFMYNYNGLLHFSGSSKDKFHALMVAIWSEAVPLSK